MVNTELRILRVFGPTAAEVSAVLRQAGADGCPGLRLLERDGEFAICVQVSAPNRAMAEQYCDKWAARLRAKFGDDVFAEGETSLAQATLDALLEKRKLLVAVDEPTGRLLGSLLQPLPHSEAVFDFGTESYADPEKQKQITVPPQLLKKFPGDVVQAAAGRALAAMQAAGADFAAVYMPATVGQCPFVLICDSHGAAACALPPDLNDATIGNQILDLLRRRVLGLRLGADDYIVKPFAMDELMARMEMVLRRAGKGGHQLQAFDVTLDSAAHMVLQRGQPVELTPREFALLEQLMRNRGAAIYRDTLMERAWGGDAETTRAVDTYITRLRKKLNWGDKIETVYQIGYRLKQE